MVKYRKIRNFRKICRVRQEQNKDVNVAVTGDKGDGKSNLIMWLGADYVTTFGIRCRDCKHEWITTQNAIEGDENNITHIKPFADINEPCPKCQSTNTKPARSFDFFKYMGYDANEVDKLLRTLPMYSPLLGDEAVRWAYSLDHNKSENKDLKKFEVQTRPKRLIVYKNIPDFVSLDKKHRNSADFWIRVMSRGSRNAIAIIFIKDKSEVDDKWHLKRMQEIMGSYNDNTPLSEIERICQELVNKHPCAYDWFYIPPVPQAVYENYEVYRNKKVFEEAKKDNTAALSDKDLGKIAIFNLLAQWKRLQENVRKGRGGIPSARMLANIVFMHPKGGHPVIHERTIMTYRKQMEKEFGNTKAFKLPTTQKPE